MSDEQPEGTEEEAEAPEGALPPLEDDPIPNQRTDVRTVGPGGEAPIPPPEEEEVPEEPPVEPPVDGEGGEGAQGSKRPGAGPR